MYNTLSQVYLSNQRDESISIQRVNYEACNLPCIFASEDYFISVNSTVLDMIQHHSITSRPGAKYFESIQIHYSYFDLSMITITLQLQDLWKCNDYNYNYFRNVIKYITNYF